MKYLHHFIIQKNNIELLFTDLIAKLPIKSRLQPMVDELQGWLGGNATAGFDMIRASQARRKVL